jgi:hypothetical protein
VNVKGLVPALDCTTVEKVSQGGAYVILEIGEIVCGRLYLCMLGCKSLLKLIEEGVHTTNTYIHIAIEPNVGSVAIRSLDEYFDGMIVVEIIARVYGLTDRPLRVFAFVAFGLARRLAP